MEVILITLAFISMIVSVVLYAYLVENKKIKPMPLGRHGGFEVRYTEEHYKQFDKKYEEENDTIHRRSREAKADS